MAKRRDVRFTLKGQRFALTENEAHRLILRVSDALDSATAAGVLGCSLSMQRRIARNMRARTGERR